MPIIKDASGRSIYAPLPQLTTAHPADFFMDNPEEFARRVERARRKVLDAIRFAERPLSGLGTCHEFVIDLSSPKSSIVQLADYANSYDDRRAKRVRSQRRRELNGGLAPGEHRLRSPQSLFRRRSTLFSGKEIPINYFDGRVSPTEIDQFVQRMRWLLMSDAVEYLHACGTLELVGGVWSVRVSEMDIHRLRPGKANPVKYDDRSWHGRPNRDRSRASVTL